MKSALTALPESDELGLSSLRASLDAVRDKYAVAAKGLEDLKRKREEIEAAPAAKSDVIAAIERHVDDIAKNYEAKLTDSLMGIARLPLELNAPNVANRDRYIWKFFGYAHSGKLSDGVAAQGALILMIGPDVVKTALRRKVEALPYQDGLPLTERAAKLQRLDEKIGKAEAALDDLRRAVSASGISFSPVSETERGISLRSV